MFSIIASVGKKREIGKNGGLVFHLSEDMRYFKDTTMGHPVVMGRKTWESLPGKLPGRRNIVVTHRELSGPDEIVTDLDDFIATNLDTSEEIFVIGGESIYRAFLPYAEKLYLTEVDATAPGADTFFPKFDASLFQKEIVKTGEENGVKFAMVKYTKKGAAMV